MMAAHFYERITKAVEYLSLPFVFPAHFGSMLQKVLINRTLVHELPRLSPHSTWLKNAGINTVVDIGAYLGSFAYAMRTILPDAQIYSFEPLPENFITLERNLNPLGKFKAFQKALGDRNGEMVFYQSDFSPSSSALEMGELHRIEFPRTSNTTKISVPVSRLDDVLPEMDLLSKVLLKVDVQGYEDVVLRNGIRTLSQVDYLITEVSYQPLYDGQVLFESLYDFLREQGFSFAGLMDSMLSPRDGSILQSDALFIKKPGLETI